MRVPGRRSRLLPAQRDLRLLEGCGPDHAKDANDNAREVATGFCTSTGAGAWLCAFSGVTPTLARFGADEPKYVTAPSGSEEPDR